VLGSGTFSDVGSVSAERERVPRREGMSLPSHE
jgi:hypothetical protein